MRLQIRVYKKEMFRKFEKLSLMLIVALTKVFLFSHAKPIDLKLTLRFIINIDSVPIGKKMM